MIKLIEEYWENFDRTYFGIKWSEDLISYLEEKLKDHECDNTLVNTKQYFSRKLIKSSIYYSWLEQHNCCDCEVLLNTDWRDGLSWRSEPKEYKEFDNYLLYKDGTKLDLRNYKNGLKSGNLLILLKDKIITDLDDEVVEKISKGTLFKVEHMHYTSYMGQISIAPYHNSNTISSLYYDDDSNFFEEYQIIDAIEFYKNKIELQKNESNEFDEMSNLYGELATAFWNENDLSSSLEFRLMAVESSIDNRGIHSGSAFLSQDELANEYLNQKKYELAIKCFKDAIKLNTDDQTYTGYTEDFKGKIKFAKKKLKEAKINLNT